MRFIAGDNTSTSEDGRLRLVQHRMEGGVGQNDFLLHIATYQGSLEGGFSLSGWSVRDPDQTNVYIHIVRRQEVENLLLFKAYLGCRCSDMDFLRIMADGVIGLFAANKWMTRRTRTAVVIDWDLAGQIDPEARSRIADQTPHDIELASVTVQGRDTSTARSARMSDVAAGFRKTLSRGTRASDGLPAIDTELNRVGFLLKQPQADLGVRSLEEFVLRWLESADTQLPDGVKYDA